LYGFAAGEEVTFNTFTPENASDNFAERVMAQIGAELLRFPVVGVPVLQAVTLLLQKDRVLLLNEAHEQTVTHRLAVYLDPLFPNWNVDCEFNRVGEEQDPKRLANSNARPDLVVHRRGQSGPENNLLYCEAKTSIATHEAEARDIAKIEDATKQYPGTQFGYQYGLYLKITTLHEVRDFKLSVNWFRGGSKA
jgi:hypothetical protein